MSDFEVLIDAEGLAIVRHGGSFEGILSGSDIEDVDVDAYAELVGLQVVAVETASDGEHYFKLARRERSLIG